MKIEDRHRKAAHAIALGGSQNDAAGAAGVARGTIQRWLQDSDFQAEVRRAQLEADALDPAELPSDWRSQASDQLCMAAHLGAATVRRAASGDPVSKSTLDAAKWAIERAGVEVKAPIEDDAPTAAEALAEIDTWVLQREIDRRTGGPH